MGVGEEFQRFKDNYNIDMDTIGSIGYRYKRITRQLNRDFWGSDSETYHSLYVGSYGRDTGARGLSDLDIGFVLPYPVYIQYNNYLGNGQSALLQAVKRSIQNTYVASDSFGDGQVVVVNFNDGIRFEILPVFENTDGSSWTYPNANAGGSWQTCNPRAEIKAIGTRSASTNRNLKHLCRMMRVWCEVNSVPMSGMLVDTLAYQFIENWAHRDKSFFYHDFMARDFFLFLAQRDPNQMYWRAPGSASTVWRKGPFEGKARAAYGKALEAIAHDGAKQDWSRRQKWREIFGTLFPST